MALRTRRFCTRSQPCVCRGRELQHRLTEAQRQLAAARLGSLAERQPVPEDAAASVASVAATPLGKSNALDDIPRHGNVAVVSLLGTASAPRQGRAGDAAQATAATAAMSFPSSATATVATLASQQQAKLGVATLSMDALPPAAPPQATPLRPPTFLRSSPQLRPRQPLRKGSNAGLDATAWDAPSVQGVANAAVQLPAGEPTSPEQRLHRLPGRAGPVPRAVSAQRFALRERSRGGTQGGFQVPLAASLDFAGLARGSQSDVHTRASAAEAGPDVDEPPATPLAVLRQLALPAWQPPVSQLPWSGDEGSDAIGTGDEGTAGAALRAHDELCTAGTQSEPLLALVAALARDVDRMAQLGIVSVRGLQTAEHMHARGR